MYISVIINIYFIVLQDTNTTSMYNGVEYELYFYQYTEGYKDNRYTILIDQTTGLPAALTFIGYDDVFGSHYDEYAFTYDKIETNMDPSVFDIYKCM